MILHWLYGIIKEFVRKKWSRNEENYKNLCKVSKKEKNNLNIGQAFVRMKIVYHS